MTTFRLKMVILLFLVLLLKGCTGHQPAETAFQETFPAADSVAATGPQRSLARTASMEFQAKDVSKAIRFIEKTTSQNGGLVIHTRLSNEIDQTRTYTVSKDSLLQIRHYTPSGEISVRLPDSHLEETMRAIEKEASFLDRLTIDSEELTYSLLEQKLALRRSEKSIASARKSKEEFKWYNREKADQAKVANLVLHDKLSYCTLHIRLKGAVMQSGELTVNTGRHSGSSFPQRLTDAWLQGWYILTDLFFLIMQCWGLVLILLIIYLIFRMLRTARQLHRRIEQR